MIEMKFLIAGSLVFIAVFLIAIALAGPVNVLCVASGYDRVVYAGGRPYCYRYIEVSAEDVPSFLIPDG